MQVKLKAGKIMYPVEITQIKDRIEFRFGFNKILKDEIKMMDGARWHGSDDPPRKVWSVKDCPRNRFQLAYLEHSGINDPLNPYRLYEQGLVNFTPSRSLYLHQLDLVKHGLTRKQGIWAAEMGTGKTLAAIELMEAASKKEAVTSWWWVAPKSALYSVQREFKKWNSQITPVFMTYEGLKKKLSEWRDGQDSPQGVIFDESSRLKNIASQRSQAAVHLTTAMRKEWSNPYIILMSGSPAPKSPADWWAQCEVACPGFLKEGTADKLRKTLAIVKEQESIIGGKYLQLVAWKDDEKKCEVCGKLELENPDHEDPSIYHAFSPCVNEVARLYRRMSGLVIVKNKKDCLDLPEKQYRIIRCKPSQSMLNAAQMILDTASSTLKANILLRELSDGFQYVTIGIGVDEECNVCKGEGRYFENDEWGTCPKCDGKCLVEKEERQAKQIPTAKEDALVDLLDEFDVVGRLVIYGGFTGSVERIVDICKRCKWKVIKADGHGWASTLPGGIQEWLSEFQEGKEERVAFVGQAGAAGMGLTLTASPAVVYYSNDFNAESRIQSEDRIHRPGMDVNRGATIIDIFNLPSDEYVYNNLKVKRKLQGISLGDFQRSIGELKNAAVQYDYV